MKLQDFSIPRFAIVACLFALLVGCASLNNSQPWIEGGARIGTIYKNKKPYGFEYRYGDLSNRLMRIEKRDAQGELLPGASITRYAYNPAGSLVKERYCDANDVSVPGPEGFAVKQLTYSSDSEGNRVLHQVFYDPQGHVVRTIYGYASIETCFVGASNTMRKITMKDENKNPASVLMDGVSGVACIQYIDLEGVGSIRCAVYYGPTGETIERKHVSGAVATYSSQTTNTYR